MEKVFIGILFQVCGILLFLMSHRLAKIDEKNNHIEISQHMIASGIIFGLIAVSFGTITILANTIDHREILASREVYELPTTNDVIKTSFNGEIYVYRRIDR